MQQPAQNNMGVENFASGGMRPTADFAGGVRPTADFAGNMGPGMGMRKPGGGMPTRNDGGEQINSLRHDHGGGMPNS